MKLPLISVIDAGLFNPQDSRTSFDCSAGICNFSDQFSSQACAQCKDVSDQLKIANITHGATESNEAPYCINSTLPSGSYALFIGDVAGDWFTLNTTDYGDTIGMVIAATSLAPGNTSDPDY